MFTGNFEIIDISQSVSESTACFPGDVPFSKRLTVTHAESGVINLTAITMSPHVGTHADAPSHIHGELAGGSDANAGALPLDAYVGPAVVLNFAPLISGAVTADMIKEAVDSLGLSELPQRVLLKTQSHVLETAFLADYAYIAVDAVEYLAAAGVKLVGIDTPSVDQISSKQLETHHALHAGSMCWLENLNLDAVEAGTYFLVAAPLKLVSAEAAPVRAILLKRAQ